MAKWFQTFFLLAAKLYMLLVLLRPSKIPLQPDAISPQLEPENICEYILDFTARFGEINPDMPYLCRREQSGLKRTVFAFFPLFGGSRWKKTLNLRFFAKKQVNFWVVYLLRRKLLIINENTMMHRQVKLIIYTQLSPKQNDERFFFIASLGCSVLLSPISKQRLSII